MFLVERRCHQTDLEGCSSDVSEQVVQFAKTVQRGAPARREQGEIVVECDFFHRILKSVLYMASMDT